MQFVSGTVNHIDPVGVCTGWCVFGGQEAVMNAIGRVSDALTCPHATSALHRLKDRRDAHTGGHGLQKKNTERRALRSRSIASGANKCVLFFF